MRHRKIDSSSHPVPWGTQVMSLFETIKSGILAGVGDVERGAIDIAHDPGKALREAGTWVYEQALGNDIKTLRSPSASVLDKVLAGVSIASNFVGPEGKLLDKGLTMIAKEALEHGGEKLLASGAERLETTLGKEAMKELAENAGKMSKTVAAGIDVAEKVIDKLNIARNVKESLTTTLEDTKELTTDFMAAVHAKPGERAAAWGEVTKDLAKEGKDFAALFAAAKQVKDAIAPEERTLAHLQHRATDTLLQDAEKFKGAGGRTFVEGKDLVIDVRTSKDFLSSTNATLKTMNAEASDAGKHLVVFDPNISDVQERKLLADGIAVAKTSGDLTKLSLAAKVPGGLGIELINLDKRMNATEIGQALHDRKEKRETLEMTAGAPAFVKSGPAEVGRFHEKAHEWDGKQSHFGSISWARDGEVQQYDRGKWISYKASQLEGDPPIEGHQVRIKADPVHPGMAIVNDPMQHEAPQVQRTQAAEVAPAR